MENKKLILDACCGGKMFWYEKECPSVLYIDKRIGTVHLQDGRSISIDPDVVADFTCLPFDDETFNLVVFDPPHLKRAGENSWLAKKYGVLPDHWKGFSECFRVLKNNGVLVFKWSCYQIPFYEVIKLSPYSPLFGDQKGEKRWTVFMKLEKGGHTDESERAETARD